MSILSISTTKLVSKLNLGDSEVSSAYPTNLLNFCFAIANKFTCLADCQARNLTKLDFHFNSSLTALNLAKWDAVQQHNSDPDFVFRWQVIKGVRLIIIYWKYFIEQLGLEPTLIKSHPNYYNLYE